MKIYWMDLTAYIKDGMEKRSVNLKKINRNHPTKGEKRLKKNRDPQRSAEQYQIF